jgi:hypothetical protein
MLFLARGIIAGVFQAAYVYTPEVRPILDTWNLPFVEEYVLRVHFGYKAGVREQTQCPHYKLLVSSSGFPTVAVKGVLIF